ncbi:MAG: FecR family protein [Pseudobacter sp.]|uniref:FecR family protein n=1 Tax=Pseudobacter sp. TaxID=2045420 RepID=UPI003F816E3F
MTRTGYLIRQFLKDQLTPDESRELDQWLSADPANRQFMQRFEEPGINTLLNRMNDIDWKEGYERFCSRHPEFATPPAVVKNIHPPVRWAAAAAVLLFLSALTWLILTRQFSPPVAVQESQQRFAEDVLPGGSKAILTIGDGKPIILDTLRTAVSGSNLLSNGNGLLEYQNSTNNTVISINTVTTPNGGTYRVLLPDGTRVWLNAASYIQFPSAFTGNERMVKASGEVYFEVAKDPARQFVVQSPHARMEVLGTCFNVSDYNDEEYTRTTLVEGSIAVSNGAGRVVLQPGSQARINAAGITKVQAADVEAEIAWKNGLFIFNGSKLPSIMKLVERWYNVKVKYDAEITSDFVGVIRRDEPLSKLLQLLELTGEVHFNITGNTVTISR